MFSHCLCRQLSPSIIIYFDKKRFNSHFLPQKRFFLFLTILAELSGCCFDAFAGLGALGPLASFPIIEYPMKDPFPVVEKLLEDGLEGGILREVVPKDPEKKKKRFEN